MMTLARLITLMTKRGRPRRLPTRYARTVMMTKLPPFYPSATPGVAATDTGAGAATVSAAVETLS